MADNTAAIAAIRELLRSGVTSTNTDGTSVTIDPESLRKELAHLIATDDTEAALRPRTFGVNFSGF